MIAQSVREEFDFILEEDKKLPKEEQTVFRLRPLTQRATNEIEDILGQNSDKGGFPVGTVNYKLLRAGLIGWTNMGGVDAGIKDQVFEHCIPDRMMLRLTTVQRTQLSNAIWGTTNVSDDDAKN